MVSAAPNLTRVTGTVRSRRPHATLPDRDAVVLAVDDTQRVPGLRDLVAPVLARAPVGDDGRREVEVVVRRELLGAAAPGWRLTCRVRVTPNGLLAEPHPAAGGFALHPPEGTEGVPDALKDGLGDGLENRLGNGLEEGVRDAGTRQGPAGAP